MKIGLQSAGKKDANGSTIKVPEGHIPTGIEVMGIKEWAKAIFVTPSIFYAADCAYSEVIMAGSKRYSVIVEAFVKPGSYKSFKATTVRRELEVKGETNAVELRVECQDAQLIRAVNGSTEDNVIAAAVLFVDKGLLEEAINYTNFTKLFKW